MPRANTAIVTSNAVTGSSSPNPSPSRPLPNESMNSGSGDQFLSTPRYTRSGPEVRFGGTKLCKRTLRRLAVSAQFDGSSGPRFNFIDVSPVTVMPSAVSTMEHDARSTRYGETSDPTRNNSDGDAMCSSEKPCRTTSTSRGRSTNARCSANTADRPTRAGTQAGLSAF